MEYFIPKEQVCEIFYTKTNIMWNILYQITSMWNISYQNNQYVKHFIPKQLVCETFYTKTTGMWNISKHNS